MVAIRLPGLAEREGGRRRGRGSVSGRGRHWRGSDARQTWPGLTDAEIINDYCYRRHRPYLLSAGRAPRQSSLDR